jgi:hypothetical protein
VRHTFTSLLLFALLLRLAVPAGFMLAPSGSDADGLTIVICTASGQQAMALDEDGHPIPPASKAGHETCPFAASALPGLASDATQLSTSVQFAAVTYALAKIQFSLTPHPGAASARGPPRLA